MKVPHSGLVRGVTNSTSESVVDYPVSVTRQLISYLLNRALLHSLRCFLMNFKTSSKILLALMVSFLVAFIFLASAAADERGYLALSLGAFGIMLSLLFGFIFNEID